MLMCIHVQLTILLCYLRSTTIYSVVGY